MQCPRFPPFVSLVVGFWRSVSTGMDILLGSRNFCRKCLFSNLRYIRKHRMLTCFVQDSGQVTTVQPTIDLISYVVADQNRC